MARLLFRNCISRRCLIEAIAKFMMYFVIAVWLFKIFSYYGRFVDGYYGYGMTVLKSDIFYIKLAIYVFNDPIVCFSHMSSLSYIKPLVLS